MDAGAGALAVWDFNGDGKPDVVVASGNGLAVLLGNGDGTVGPSASSFPTTYPVAVVAAAANVGGPGAPGVVALHWTPAAIGGLLELPDGGLGSEQVTALPGRPSGMAVGDFNGDGTLDVAVGTGDDHAIVLLGSGSGELSATANTCFTGNDGGRLVGVASADFNGDRIADLALIDAAFATVTVLPGNGAGGCLAERATRPSCTHSRSRSATSMGTGGPTSWLPALPSWVSFSIPMAAHSFQRTPCCRDPDRDDRRR